MCVRQAEAYLERKSQVECMRENKVLRRVHGPKENI